MASDTLTLIRGPSPRTVIVGDLIANTITAASIRSIEGVTDGREIVDLPVETTPSSISNTKYNAFGILCKLPSGKFFMAYREGSGHGGTSDFGIIRMRTSTDEGKTWSSAVTIASVSSTDLRDVGGGVTRTGRIVIWYGTYDPSHFANPGAGGFPLTLGYRYSDDEGNTWSSFTTITTTPNDYTFAADGEMIEIGNGRLMKNWYGYTISGGGIGTTSIYAIFSDDNGATWGSQVTIASSSSVQWDESSFAYLGGGYIVGISRISNGTTFKQTHSTDNGATWTIDGDTTFDSWSTPSPPALSVFADVAGERQVACYYTNRNAGKLRVVTASAQTLIASNVSAWGAHSDLLGSLPTDCGYIGVVHPYAAGRGFGWIYNASSSSVADIEFFLSSLGVVSENNLALSDVTTDDVSTSKHGFAPKSPNDATKYLDGTGAYSTPTSSSVIYAPLTDGTVPALLFTGPGDVIVAPD